MSGKTINLNPENSHALTSSELILQSTAGQSWLIQPGTPALSGLVRTWRIFKAPKSLCINEDIKFTKYT